MKPDEPGAGKASPFGPGDLASIDLRCGVNEAGEGFITVVVSTTKGRIILGQLDPTTTRTMALQWLEVAEAAEQDAAVLRTLRKLDLPDELAGLVVTELRNSRAS